MRVIVTGDHGVDTFIYVENYRDQPPDLREAWVGTDRFWIERLSGGAGALKAYLSATGIEAVDLYSVPDNNLDLAESIYTLSRQGKNNPKWRVGRAITAGERDYASCELCNASPEKLQGDAPALILDFNQGWFAENFSEVAGFLKGRKYIIRTHDPRKHDTVEGKTTESWVDIRKSGIGQGIWFSPIQDMANGGLWFAGTWEEVCLRAINYLKVDDTLYDNERDDWKHYIVIQIRFDGVLVLGPGSGPEGKLWIFTGDQPDSFSRKGYAAVVAGGTLFMASLLEAVNDPANLLEESAKRGLARARKVVEEGYVGPGKQNTSWSSKNIETNLPFEKLKDPETRNISLYELNKPPAPSWDTACKIVCGDKDDLKEVTVLTLGNLITACPDYAGLLLRLSSRLKTHASKGKDILSFTIFGGPGSGKSFVAEQLANAVDPQGKVFEKVTYNISQFNDPDRLVDAFQQIQAIGLQGKIPFVLFDEFDTTLNRQKAGWLPYFLMPMQDGKFFDGIADRALGKCVFVFIGGTYDDDSEFQNWMTTKQGKGAKGPDFHSRLDSSITVPSVDVAEPPDLDSPDPARLVRAIMLRAFLSKHRNLKVIAGNVLVYLLHVPLVHGVRSLQRIIKASELSKTTAYRKAHLPPLNVLSLHVKDLDTTAPNPVMTFLESTGLKKQMKAKKMSVTIDLKR